MTRDVVTVDAGQTLVEAARLMWDHDCGALPLVSAIGKVRGMITDRDVCRALTKGRLATRIPVREVASVHAVRRAVPGMHDHLCSHVESGDDLGFTSGLAANLDGIGEIEQYVHALLFEETRGCDLH